MNKYLTFWNLMAYDYGEPTTTYGIKQQGVSYLRL